MTRSQLLWGVAALILVPVSLGLVGWVARDSAAALLWLANGLAPVARDRLQANIRYGPHPQNQLDLYLPPTQPQTGDETLQRPVVIFFYGGCWGACLRFYKSDYRFVAQSLAAAGYVVVIPDYRHYPAVKFPAIMDDATAVVEWVSVNIEQYGGDPNQLFLMGHSAGAQMAALLTFNPAYLTPAGQARVRGFIGLAGPYDFLPFDQAYQPRLFGPEENYPLSQPINFVKGHEPPLLLLYGNDDTVVYPHNLENLAQKVRTLGGPVEVHRYDGIDHAGLVGALARPVRDRQPVYGDILQFLTQHTQQPAQQPARAELSPAP